LWFRRSRHKHYAQARAKFFNEAKNAYMLPTWYSKSKVKDYYRILRVKRTATLQEIKKAYRDQSIKLHPDKGGDIAKFKELPDAIRTLEDPVLRREYDHDLFR